MGIAAKLLTASAEGALYGGVKGAAKAYVIRVLERSGDQGHPRPILSGTGNRKGCDYWLGRRDNAGDLFGSRRDEC